MLQLTYKDLHSILDGDIDRFKVLYDDIPKDEHSSNYIEDDGRQYRIVEFLDTQTNETYNFNYCWNNTWGYEFPIDLMGTVEGVEFVNTSEFTEPPKVVVEPVKELTAILVLNNELTARYLLIKAECSELNPRSKSKNSPIPKIKELIDWMHQINSFSLLDLRVRILPICIEYKIDMDSTWRYIQSKWKYKR